VKRCGSWHHVHVVPPPWTIRSQSEAQSFSHSWSSQCNRLTWRYQICHNDDDVQWLAPLQPHHPITYAQTVWLKWSLEARRWLCSCVTLVVQWVSRHWPLGLDPLVWLPVLGLTCYCAKSCAVTLPCRSNFWWKILLIRDQFPWTGGLK